MQKKAPVINHIWFWLIVIPILAAIATGRMEDVTKAGFESAALAVELALKLIGVMTLWLGLTKIAEAGGLMTMIANGLKPVMRRIFPSIPEGHPALGAMVMNFSANMLGLGNAATPLGIKAMMELNRLNRTPGQATNAMILFLAINTSSIAILPLGVIGVRAAAGASNPADILVPGLLATICSTTVAIAVGLLINRLRPDPAADKTGHDGSADAPATASAGGGGATIPAADDPTTVTAPNEASATTTVPDSLINRLVPILVVLLALAAIVWRLVNGDMSGMPGEIVKWWMIPLIMVAILLFGYRRGVNVYEAACDGGREGFQTAVRIIPYLVMILVAIGIFRASGAFEMVTSALDPLTSLVGLPSEVLPIAILRPLTGSGSFALMSEITANAPNGFPAYLAGIMQGSTETTFYVLAVYFGSVGITKIRHALFPALLADLTGIAAAIIFARVFFG
ncbi:MAG TPA: nucleoside recognition domain-containing protein [Myxococcota bacterium]|nr:nucleoside recognition domain-containing protein [Myxococcota bacterium]HOD00300.1 nucleoside recognition domain-containing protein [Myxococcota bacterium]HOH77269.1 nucleoside recognition domain-containing protein [Myxococcota bacterium]